MYTAILVENPLADLVNLSVFIQPLKSSRHTVLKITLLYVIGTKIAYLLSKACFMM
jgi:hypothetical protein